MQPGSATHDLAAIRVRQVGVVILGIVAALAMLWLGWWQAQVYQTQGTDASRARAAEPDLRLDEAAPVGARPNDAFGRTVFFSGYYAPESQILVPEAGYDNRFRILAALVRDDGSAVAVVRGVWEGPAEQAPLPPTGRVDQRGVLLPSEPSDNRPVASDQLSSVRLAALSQRWDWPLVGGVVTLTQDEATAQGLGWQQPELPREGGELRNGAYAVQWWVFAAFALILAAKIARDIGRPLVEAETTAPAGRP